MPYYHAFGLHIKSAIPLPELIAADPGAAQAEITHGTVPGRFHAERSAREHAYYQARPDRVVLHWPEVGAFAVEDGARIIMDLGDGVPNRLARLPLLGPVIGALLMQRRRLVLHASAVAVGGAAVGFIGVKGAGKSTTSAALHRAGHPLVTDDLLAVRSVEDGTIVVDPGFPRFKLWPDAAEAALRDDPMSLPPLHDGIEKRERWADGTFSTAPLPLKAIYVLARGEAVGTEPLEGREALFELLPHVYNNTLVDAIGEARVRQWHFERCARLAKHVSVRALRRPPDLSRLPEIAEHIAAEMKAISY